MVRFEHRQEWHYSDAALCGVLVHHDEAFRPSTAGPTIVLTDSAGPLAQLLQRTSECLAAGEHGPEEVAVLFHALERLAHPEAARRHVLC